MMKPDDDPIQPVRIEHSVDEVWSESTLEQRYNYLDYHFIQDESRCRARSYTDDFEQVVVFGERITVGDLNSSPSSSFERDVHAYLDRRFEKVLWQR